MPKPNTTTKLETEAKFIVPDQATFEVIKKTEGLGGFQLKPVGTKIITDLYLDTAGKGLLQAGYACRLRHDGKKQILSLKALTPPQGNVHRRQEIEQEVDTDQPQSWPKGKAKDLVLSIVGRETLHPLVALHQTRHQYHVIFEHRPIIELSLDEVWLGEAGKVDYFELEAELFEAGTEADLRQFIDALPGHWLLQPESQSKFERALAYVNA